MPQGQPRYPSWQVLAVRGPQGEHGTGFHGSGSVLVTMFDGIVVVVGGADVVWVAGADVVWVAPAEEAAGFDVAPCRRKPAIMSVA
jgi:hypothetical protein